MSQPITQNIETTSSCVKGEHAYRCAMAYITNFIPQPQGITLISVWVSNTHQMMLKTYNEIPGGDEYRNTGNAMQ